MAFVRNLIQSTQVVKAAFKNPHGSFIKSTRFGSTYPINDDIFGLSDDQKQVGCANKNYQTDTFLKYEINAID